MRANRSGTARAAADVGVPTGLEGLFEAEYEPMYRLVFAMLSSNADSEEVVQDAFASVASRWESIDNPGGYLRVSVVNGARKCLRTRSRRSGAEALLRGTTDNTSSGEDYLLDVVDKLPDRQRMAVVLTYYSGLNSTEVGELLDCPSATVRSLVHRALAQLREEVKP